MELTQPPKRIEGPDAFKKEYFARIHRAQDYIEENLGHSLQLDEIARAACFSPYHFHRLYTAMTGETLYQFIQRIRLERAASRLCRQPHESVTMIAIDLGFSSSATFARAFRSAFGMSASEYKRANHSKDRKTLGNIGKVSGAEGGYPELVDFDMTNRRNFMSSIQTKSIEVKNLEARHLAYVRHVGRYAGDADLFGKLFGKVFSWAGPRGLFVPGKTEAITVYHDDPEITAEDRLRISVGLTVPPATSCSGDVSLLEIPAGQYVCAIFEIDVSEYAAAWDVVCADWLPQSGWQPGDGPCYECYLNDPQQHPQGKHIVEIRMSVKPL
jgi:AraC family transcriptional regulator